MATELLEMSDAAVMVRDDGQAVLVLREGLLPDDAVRLLDHLLSVVEHVALDDQRGLRLVD